MWCSVIGVVCHWKFPKSQWQPNWFLAMQSLWKQTIWLQCRWWWRSQWGIPWYLRSGLLGYWLLYTPQPKLQDKSEIVQIQPEHASVTSCIILILSLSHNILNQIHILCAIYLEWISRIFDNNFEWVLKWQCARRK